MRGPTDHDHIGVYAWGEFNGHRNGHKGFFLRDDFLGNAD